MNFENMPELKSEHGYFLTLGVMALVTLVLLIYFWRRGWIFQKEPIVTDTDRDSDK
jgi:magnesium transporter